MSNVVPSIVGNTRCDLLVRNAVGRSAMLKSLMSYRCSALLPRLPIVWHHARGGGGARSSSSAAATLSDATARIAATMTKEGLLRSSGSRRYCFDASSIASRVETGLKQLTLMKGVTKRGVGLHTGETAEVRLLPAPAGVGRYFVFGDGDGGDGESCRIPATLERVRETTLSTCLGGGRSTVRTVEHLLSALEGLGVDNCRIEIRGGNEVPLLDGSASDWVAAIEAAGLSTARDESEREVPRRAFVLNKPVSVHQGDSFVKAFPAPHTSLTYGIDFPQVQAIGNQWFTWSPEADRAYQKDVAPARTFGIFEQISQLQDAGLIKGGSLENALVCSSEKGWLNPPLRFANEPCRHKMLDLIGDLALCADQGHPGLPVASIVAYKASHALHVKFGRALLQQ